MTQKNLMMAAVIGAAGAFTVNYLLNVQTTLTKNQAYAIGAAMPAGAFLAAKTLKVV